MDSFEIETKVKELLQALLPSHVDVYMVCDTYAVLHNIERSDILQIRVDLYKAFRFAEDFQVEFVDGETVRLHYIV